MAARTRQCITQHEAVRLNSSSWWLSDDVSDIFSHFFFQFQRRQFVPESRIKVQTLPSRSPVSSLWNGWPLLLHQGTRKSALYLIIWSSESHFSHLLITGHILILLPFPISPHLSLVQCKLDYQACMSGKKIAVKCPGICPCPAQPEESSAERKGKLQRSCTHNCTLGCIAVADVSPPDMS